MKKIRLKVINIEQFRFPCSYFYNRETGEIYRLYADGWTYKDWGDLDPVPFVGF